MATPISRSWKTVLLLGLVTLLTVGPTTTTTLAQAKKPNYRELRINPELLDGKAKNKSLFQTKSRAVGGSESFAGAKAQLDEWYNSYFFPSFTKPNLSGQLPVKRREILADLARAGSRQSTQDLYLYLRNIAMTYGRGFAESAQFHPYVRYNAVLLLGDLNNREKSIAQQRKFPEPYYPALVELIKALKQPQQIDAVRVAALIGIARHAKLQWSGDNKRIPAPARKAIVREAFKIVNAPDPPPGRSADGHAWMQRKSIEILAAFKLVGAYQVVNDAIVSILSNPEADLGLRCAAAKSLAMLNPKGRAPLDFDDTALRLGALAAHCVRTELAWMDNLKLQKEIKKIAKEAAAGGGGPTGGSGGMDGAMGDMAGGMDGEMGAPDDEGSDDSSAMMGDMGGSSKQKDPELDLAQRRLRTKLVYIKAGLDAIANAAQGSTQVSDVVEMVDTLMQSTEPPRADPTLDAIETALKRNVRDLETLTQSVVPAAAEEEPVSAAPSAAPVSSVP